MKVLGFQLENDEKVDRAINGSITDKGTLSGGVGSEPEALIAEYDRLGGYISKDGLKVTMGSFYDFKGRCPRKEPQVTFMTELEGQQVEVTEEEARAIEAARNKMAGIRSNLASGETTKPKSKRKKKVEETEEKIDEYAKDR